MATKTWKGFLNFGLLSIPVFLNVAARDKRVETRNFHKACNSPVKMPKYCEHCNCMLQPTEIYRGYEAPTGIIPLGQEELDAIAPATEKVMDIAALVPAKDVDPIYMAESFYLLPDGPGSKAYSLLCKTLVDTNRMAIAQLTKSNREHMVVIRPKGNGLVLNFLWYENEIAKVPEFDNFQPVALSAAELKAAKQLAENLEGDFHPEEFEDGYMQRLNTLIESKLDSTIAAPTPVKAVTPPAMDIMAALTASLTNKPKRKITLKDQPLVPPITAAPAAKAKGKKGKAA